MLTYILAALIAAIGIAGGAYSYGYKHATNACAAEKLVGVQQDVAEAGRVNKATTKSEAGTVGSLAANTNTFRKLRAEVPHVSIAPDPNCHLSVDGLRLWNSANRGDTAGAAGGVTRAVPRGPAGGEKR